MINCVNHKDREGDFYCPQCVQGFCDDCVHVKKFEGTELKLCPLCNNPLRAITVERPDPPFRSDFLDILRFPFHGYGLLALLTWPILAVIIRGIPVLIFFEFEDSIKIANPSFHFIYFILAIVIFMQAVNGAGNGAFEFPTVKLRGTFVEIINNSSKQILAPFIGLFWPVIIACFIFWLLFEPSPSTAQHFLTYAFFILLFAYFTFALFLLPISLLVASMFNDPSPVFNPFYLIGQIKIIRRDYFFFLLGIVCAFGGYTGIRYLWMEYLFERSFISYVAFFAIDGAIHIYSIMVIGLLLGNMSYRRRYQLKWLPYTDEKPRFTLEEKTAAEDKPITEPSLEMELAQKSSHAAYLLDHGNYEDASLIFKEILDEYPDNFEALGGRVRAAFGLEDNDTVKECAKKIAAQLLKQHAHMTLWDTYQSYRKKIEDLIFDPPEMIGLARWLNERELHLEAARVLRELALGYPEDEHAPEALYNCARLLWEKCNKPDTAENIFNIILERYPDTEFFEKAKKILAEIKTGD